MYQANSETRLPQHFRDEFAQLASWRARGHDRIQPTSLACRVEIAAMLLSQVDRYSWSLPHLLYHLARIELRSKYPLRCSDSIAVASVRTGRDHRAKKCRVFTHRRPPPPVPPRAVLAFVHSFGRSSHAA